MTEDNNYRGEDTGISHLTIGAHAPVAVPRHVPQCGLNFARDGYERNPYHATCPECGARGNCDLYIECVGYVVHPARRVAAAAAAECQECVTLYGPQRSLDTLRS